MERLPGNAVTVPAVKVVPGQRVTDGCKVHPDLMGAARHGNTGGKAQALRTGRSKRGQRFRTLKRQELLRHLCLDEERAQSILKMTDSLEEDDDVQNVYTNMDIPEDVLKQIQGD